MTNPIDDIVYDPESLVYDRVLDNHPKHVTDQELVQLVHKMRADRALFIKAEARKREGGDTEPEETPDGSVA